MQEIKEIGFLRMDDKLDNVDYYIGNNLVEEENLSIKLNSLINKRIDFSLRVIEDGTVYCEEGILKYDKFRNDVEKLYIVKGNGSYFDLDNVLWYSVGKEIEIQVNVVNMESSISKEGTM